MVLSKEQFGKEAALLWKQFVRKEQLTEKQEKRFAQYMRMFLAWNEKINLTSITDVPSVIAYHFQDSMRIANFVDLSSAKGIADVGSGGGFPGIPLSILYPDLLVVLIEVSQKKVAFLEAVIKELGLKNCLVSSLDWRTFLRNSSYEIDFAFARASLRPDELIRMFKPGCPYREGTLVYWASKTWQVGPKEEAFFVKKERYHVGSKERMFFFFTKKD